MKRKLLSIHFLATFLNHITWLIDFSLAVKMDTGKLWEHRAQLRGVIPLLHAFKDERCLRSIK